MRVKVKVWWLCWICLIRNGGSNCLSLNGFCCAPAVLVSRETIFRERFFFFFSQEKAELVKNKVPILMVVRRMFLLKV
jgi:hypothetical protein